MKPRFSCLSASIPCLILLHCSAAWGVGFRLPNQDPEAIARGNAFVATADNPSAVYHNPAGISQLEGSQISLGFYLISVGTGFESPTGERARTDRDVQLVPQLHYVFSPQQSRFSYGMGIYAPYGLGIDYGAAEPFSTIAQKASLAYVSLNPVIAYQINDALSLAAGLTLNYSRAEISQAVGLAPGDRLRIDVDDWAPGYTVGLLWRLHQQWSFGLSYRSETEFSYSATTSIRTYAPHASPTRADFLFPRYLDAGLAYRPDENWLIELNLDWTQWDRVNSTTFNGTALGDIPFVLNYQNSLMYELGVTRKLGNLLFSVGYIFSENSAPDQNFTPLNPDANLHLGSMGISSRGEGFGWAVAYHFAYSSERVVRGNQAVSLLGESVDGSYKTLNHALNFALRYGF